MRHASPPRFLIGLAGLLGLLVSCRDEPPPPPSPPPASALPALPAPPAGAQVPVTTSSEEARTLFMKGRNDADNTREAEAINAFREATQKDPKFALAYAYLGYYQQGTEGDKNMQTALGLERGLPEPERLVIDELAALRAGDNEKARTLALRVVQLSPFDWHAQLDLGNRLYTEHRYAEAEQAFGKAAAFGPAAAIVFNELGYLYLTQHRFDPAVTEFRKYAELRPNEPNTFDSIGEGLMAVGKLDEAEQSFRKAAELKFAFAWGGVAETRFLRGDWSGGMEALGKSREAAVLPGDKLDVDAMAFWATLAQHKTDDALARADALEKEAKDGGLDDQYAASAAYRAAAFLDEGRIKDALDELGKATTRLDKATTATRSLLPVRRLTLMLRAIAEARLLKAPDAEKTAAELTDLAKKAPAQGDYGSMVPFGKGMALLARSERRDGIARLLDCYTEDLLCRRELLLAQEQSNDNNGAAATAAELLKVNLRDPLYVYVRSKIPNK